MFGQVLITGTDLGILLPNRIAPKASQLEAEDWDTGAAITLQLDPTKQPMEVAEGLYKKARKLRRAIGAVQPLLEGAQQELEYLETVRRVLAQLLFRVLAASLGCDLWTSPSLVLWDTAAAGVMLDLPCWFACSVPSILDQDFVAA